MAEKLPDTEKVSAETIKKSSEQYHWAWRPRWWLVIGLPTFIVATGALFIATRYWVGHPNDTPAFVSGVIGMITLGAILLQILVSRRQWEAMREALNRTDTLIEQNKEIIVAAQRQALAAENTLAHTVGYFELTERPALGIESIYPSVNTDGSVGIYGVLINSGKVAAKILEQEVSGGFIEPSDKISRGEVPEPPPTTTKFVGSTNIHVNGKRDLPFFAMTREEWSKVADGTELLFIWTRCTYKGIYGGSQTYILEHYSGYDWTLKAFIPAPIHNEIT